MAERGSPFASLRRRVRARRLGLPKGHTIFCDHCGGDLLANGHKAGCSAQTGNVQNWESRCHFCGGQARPFRVPDALWPADKLGQEQTCFNCFYDALDTFDVLEVTCG